MKTLEENKPDINELRRILEIRNKENLFSVQMGIQGTVIEEGYAETELVIEPKHLNLNHSVHGGCLYTLADNAGGACASSHGHRVSTLSGESLRIMTSRPTHTIANTASASADAMTPRFAAFAT